MKIRLVGPLDPNFAWDGERLLGEEEPAGRPPPHLRGATAWMRSTERGVWSIGRDPLGINKLFWVADEETLVFASRPWRLIEAGYAFEEIRAVPRGAFLRLGQGETTEETLDLDSAGSPGSEPGYEAWGRQIRATLDEYLDALAFRHGDRRAYVCLSGGLDSSTITVLAREHFSDLVAVSFDLLRPGGGESEDRRVARRLARELGLELLEVTVGADALLDALDTVLIEGIDWRDFNVHAGLVNAALADGIRDASSDESPLVVTGDLANEFLADYEPETHAGATYYRLPRLELGALRASLVRGLDTTHREVGVFAAWGLPLVQPFAVAVDHYLSIPSRFLADGDRKERLCKAIVGSLLPEYVYGRSKTRAQLGGPGAEGGVLAVCVDRGLGSRELRRRFAQLSGVEDESALDRFIRAGRYRAAVPSTGDGHGHD